MSKYKLKPSHMPALVYDMAKWTRSVGRKLWPVMAFGGSIFHYPEGLFTFDELANYHATTLENSHMLFVGKDISYLAAKTEMDKFRLERDLLPSKFGAILWEIPIGTAESVGRVLGEWNPNTGEMNYVEVIDSVLEEYRKSETPVNMVTWRLIEDEVLLCFYSDGEKAKIGLRNYRNAMEEEGVNMPSEYFSMRDSDPQPMEREQVLPIGVTLEWMKGYLDGGEGVLQPTISISPRKLEASKAKGLDKEMVAAHDKYVPVLNQMVKTFVATLHLRKMKIADESGVSATPKVKKRMSKRGAPEALTERRVSVVRVGRLKRGNRSPKGGGKGSPWGVKTVVGPVWRSRQYIPATGEYDESGRMIEPYVAGPDDAPWSESARVYLLD